MRLLLVSVTLGIILCGAALLGPLCEAGQAQSLSPVFREAINQSWYELSPQERSRALGNYRRFQRLPEEKRRGIEEQYQRWQQLPAEEQERIRRNYRRYRGMDSDEKEDFQRKYKQWRSLPR